MRSSSSRQYQIVGVVIVLIAGLVISANAEIPGQISYQGMLTDDMGTPLSGDFLIRFNIYGSETGTDSLWSSGYQTVHVNEGLFIYRLGSNVPIPDDLFAGSATRYLGIKVSADPEIEPRTRFLAVQYAYHALRADSADWNGLTNVPAGFADGIDDIGEGSKWTVTDSVLYTNNYWGIARGGAGNVLYGDSAHTMVNLGVICTTGVDGSNSGYVTISGGFDNTAKGYWNTVGGGYRNESSQNHATIGGGAYNLVNQSYATIGGGVYNTASDEFAVISGGGNNTASGYAAAVGGGKSDTASGDYATVGGGYYNRAIGYYATVGGGRFNIADSNFATVGGGYWNLAIGYAATVGGGEANIADSKYAAVGGGYYNQARGYYATVGGGNYNEASDYAATVGGGGFNIADSNYATVGGGRNNVNHGAFSTIPGGYADTIEASADYSYLFGIGSSLTEDSTFMVDMPHIRFGNEDGGYEFPTTDGTTDQVLATDGSGQLSWADSPTASSKWVVTDSVLYTNSYWGIARGGAGNVLYGDSAHTMVNLGVACTTGTAGSDFGYVTIGGGVYNSANGSAATIGGGFYNQASGFFPTVGGGYFNKASNAYATVGGGYYHSASGGGAVVGGGINNIANGFSATVSGGSCNVNHGDYSTIPGGYADTIEASADYSFLFGIGSSLTEDSTFMVDMPHIRFGNEGSGYEFPTSDGTTDQVLATDGSGQLSWADSPTASSKWVVTDSVLYTNSYWGIARGGAGNVLYGDNAHTMVNLGVICTTGVDGSNSGYVTIGGGRENTAIDSYATVGGGYNNSADSTCATVGGGWGNIASGDVAAVSGGEINTASGEHSAVSGGRGNTASGGSATIGGGRYNTANGIQATIGGGRENTASISYATVGGGWSNTASGYASTVPGGQNNMASGLYSFAAGRRAKADSAGSYVWADNTDADFTASAVNGFHVRASGGVYMYTSSDLSTGAYLSSGGGTWSSVCDSTLKRNIREVDYRDMVEKVAALPVSRWSYKTQDESIEHVGPMAQDFYRLFGLGDDDKHLTTLDLAGVSLAAIKGLYEMNQQQKAQLDKQAKEISDLKEELLRLTLMVEGKAGIE